MSFIFCVYYYIGGKIRYMSSQFYGFTPFLTIILSNAGIARYFVRRGIRQRYLRTGDPELAGALYGRVLWYAYAG